MNIQEVVLSYIPSNSRNSSGGWRSFNCPCCVDNGEPRPDTRQRGGIRFETDLISYHCFNCGFTASHRKGRTVNKKFLRFMKLLGIPDSDIKRLQLDSIREKELSSGPSFFVPTHNTISLPAFPEVQLPKGTFPLTEWLMKADEPPENSIYAAKYLIDRGVYDHVDAYWCNDMKFRKRVIFPYWQGSTIVGYAARDFTGRSETKYLAQAPNGYLYNIHKILEPTKFLIVVEGVIDAAALDCVGVLSNEAGQAQIDYLNQYKGEIIVCPDRDNAGKKLAKQAIENGWSVSFPEWQSDIKDAADAVNRYGKFYTLKSIIDGRISNTTKINVKLKIK
jgi:hypothetical protein